MTSWLRTPPGTNSNTDKLQLDSHSHTHTHTQYDPKNGRADTQRTPCKTPEEATAGATQNRTGQATRLHSTFYPTCLFLLASNPVGTFRFNYNTNKIKVGPGVTQRARNTSLQGKIWPILLTEASGSYSWKERILTIHTIIISTPSRSTWWSGTPNTSPSATVATTSTKYRKLHLAWFVHFSKSRPAPVSFSERLFTNAPNSNYRRFTPSTYATC